MHILLYLPPGHHSVLHHKPSYNRLGKNVPDKSLTSMHLTLPLPLDLYVASLNQACKRALDGVADEGTPASARTGDWGRGKARLCFFHFP